MGYLSPFVMKGITIKRSQKKFVNDLKKSEGFNLSGFVQTKLDELQKEIEEKKKIKNESVN